jgi:hypothetical protein
MGGDKYSKIDMSGTTVHANYMHVIPNSHFWTDLNQIVNSIEYELQRRKVEATKDDRIIGGTIYLGEPLTKEYIIIGLNNTLKNRYKLKPIFNSEDIKVVKSDNPIFTTVDQMIKYVESEDYAENMFYVMLNATIAAQINLTNGMKMQRNDIYKRIDGERDYQDANWGSRRQMDGTPDEEKPVAEWINYIEYHVSKAKDKVYHLDTVGATAELRKVAALAVRAMEIHGCPEREK